jgi:hypothetical protein
MKPAADMTIEERELTLRWIEGWKQAGPVLEELRAAEIREANTVRSMEMLDGLFDHAAKSTPPRESSGLIEQQRIFSRAHLCQKLKK